jgi:hypothetical protein
LVPVSGSVCPGLIEGATVGTWVYTLPSAASAFDNIAGASHSSIATGIPRQFRTIDPVAFVIVGLPSLATISGIPPKRLGQFPCRDNSSVPHVSTESPRVIRG